VTLFVHWVLAAATSLALVGVGVVLGAPFAAVCVLAALGFVAGYGLGYVGVVQPMRTLRARLQAQREQSLLVQCFLDNAPMVIAAKGKDGRYLSANAEFERLHGISSQSLVGKLDLDFMPLESAQAVRTTDQRVLDAGESLRYQVPMQTSRGLRQMEAIKFALLDAQRHTVGVGLVATDVTEREVSSEKFSRVFHASPNWIVITRLADGVVIDANEGFEHIGGYSRVDAIGHPIGDLNIWVHLEQRAEIVGTLLRDGRVLDAKVQLRRKDGEIRDFVANAVLIDLEGQTNSHAVWIARDVTEELALHEKFVMAFRLTPDFMSISRLADGRYVEVNDAFLRFTGYSREEVMGRTALDIGLWHSPEQRESMLEIIAREQEVRGFEAQLCDRHGTVRECVGHCSVFSSQGEQYMIAVIRDITNAKLAERAMRESEARFFSLFEMSPVPTTYSFDADNYTTYHRNAAFYSTFGYDKATTQKMTFAEMGLWVDPNSAETSRELLRRFVDFDNWVLQLRHADGRHLWVSIFGRPIHEADRKMMVWTVINITEQRGVQHKIEELNASLEQRVQQRTEQLQAANADLSQAMRTLEQARDRLVQSEKLASLGALVAGVAHELNTPIGNGLTVATALDERARVFAEIIKQPMQRSVLEQFVGDTQLASDLLVRSLSRSATLVSGFKRIAVDQTSEQRRSFELAGLVDEVVLTMGPTTRRARCMVRTDIAADLVLDSFPGPLDQVLTNLIDNAITHGFGQDQSGTIEIRGHLDRAGWVQLTVRDTGHGIAPENLKRVFDPFFTTRLGQGGSGLGLHIVHNIVTNVLGGQIEVYSEVATGTRFVLFLPLIAPPASPKDAAQT